MKIVIVWCWFGGCHGVCLGGFLCFSAFWGKGYIFYMFEQIAVFEVCFRGLLFFNVCCLADGLDRSFPVGTACSIAAFQLKTCLM